MFSKTPAPAKGAPPAQAPARTPVPAEPVRRAAARMPSMLGPDLTYEGSISGEGELHVDGLVRGDIQVARLVIGETARIEGKVRCGQVEVRGRVTGDIEAKSVKLFETAHVEGDITHEQLSIEVGAFFQGRCQQFVRQSDRANIVELTPAE
jgi:cytoskeletal protein CcmA (bactofilin family)